MNVAKLKIHIIPANRNLSAIHDFDSSQDGSNFSLKNSINVNQIADGYSVLFTDNVFKYLDVKLFVGNMIKIFTSKIPDTIFNVSIHYHYTTVNCSYDYYDYDTARKVYELHGTMMMLVASNQMQYLQYSESETLNKMFEDINNTSGEMNDGSDDMKILSRYGAGRNEIHGNWINNVRNQQVTNNSGGYIKPNFRPGEEEYVKGLLKSCNALDDSYDYGYDDDDYDDERDISRRDRRYYGESRVFRNSKRPKEIIQKHNLLVTKDIDDIKDDIKIIKSFLKDFIPGNARWKKRFRAELLQRWMVSFVISKKNMKKFEKICRKKMREDEIDENVSTMATLFQSYQNSK